MKYYKELVKIPTFTLAQASILMGNKPASKNLNYMINNGSVHRIKQNLYTCINLATGDDCANRFQIASNITLDSFVAYHSAFEYYACYNQIYFQVQVCSTLRFSNFNYDDYEYKSYLTHSLEGVDLIQGVRVSSIERTIIDSINMLEIVMDLEELVKCLDLVLVVNEDKLLKMLEIYDKEILYRKVGYILSFYKEDFQLSDDFFKICKIKGVKSNKGYLVSSYKTNKKNLLYNSEWGLYVYDNIRHLAYKGGEIDA